MVVGLDLDGVADVIFLEGLGDAFSWYFSGEGMLVLCFIDIFGFEVDVVVEEEFFFGGGKDEPNDTVDGIDMGMIFGKPVDVEVFGGEVDVPDGEVSRDMMFNVLCFE